MTITIDQMAHGQINKTALIQVRAYPTLKAEAEAYAAEHGTTLSELVRSGLAQVIEAPTVHLTPGASNAPGLAR